MIGQARAAFDRWLFDAWSACLPGLPVVRIIWATTVLAMYVSQQLWWLPYPDAMMAPAPGLPRWSASLLGGMPPEAVARGVDVLLGAAALLTLVGYRTRLATATAALSLLALNVWAYSFGKINHDLLLLVVPVVGLLGGWGRSLSVDAVRRGRDGSPAVAHDNRDGSACLVAIFAVLVAVLMLTAAVQKVRGGWLDLDRRAVERHVFVNVGDLGRAPLLAGPSIELTPGWLWELQDWATVGLEAAFVVALASPRTFRLACAIAVFFHVGVYLTMDIFFVSNLVAYAVFADWRRHLERPGLTSAVGRVTARLAALPDVLLVGLAFAAGAGLSYAGPPSAWTTFAVGSSDIVVTALVGLAIAAGAAGWCCWAFARDAIIGRRLG